MTVRTSDRRSNASPRSPSAYFPQGPSGRDRRSGHAVERGVRRIDDRSVANERIRYRPPAVLKYGLVHVVQTGHPLVRDLAATRRVRERRKRRNRLRRRTTAATATIRRAVDPRPNRYAAPHTAPRTANIAGTMMKRSGVRRLLENRRVRDAHPYCRAQQRNSGPKDIATSAHPMAKAQMTPRRRQLRQAAYIASAQTAATAGIMSQRLPGRAKLLTRLRDDLFLLNQGKRCKRRLAEQPEYRAVLQFGDAGGRPAVDCAKVGRQRDVGKHEDHRDQAQQPPRERSQRPETPGVAAENDIEREG